MDKPKCKEKLAFKTKEEARAAIALTKWRYQTGKLKVYKCKHCNLWHIATDRDDD